MAKIRAEAPPKAPAAVFVSDQSKFRRWFSTAAVFFLVMTATVIGSRVLPFDQEIDVAPVAMDTAHQNKALSREASGGEDRRAEAPALKAAADTEADTVARSGDLPAEEPSDSAQRSTYSTLHATEGSNDSNSSVANSSPKASPEKEAADDTVSSEPAYGGSANTFAPDSLMLQPAPPEDDTYTVGGSPESETTSPGDRGLSADQLLDSQSAELLLLDYLALPPSSPVTVTYQGLTPEEDAHLFLVTRPETVTETYSVDRTEGTVTLLPPPDPAPTLTP